ncbi:MAG: GFA family protein [Candidatus Binatus sp.]
MIHGSCLCGAIRFEFTKPAGPFELCHCRRCRKVSGSAFFSGLYVRIEDFRLIAGKDLITTYDAPMLREPPAYRASFCSRCGSPVPNPNPEPHRTRGRSGMLEIPAGLLDDDPGMKPDKHIFVEVKSVWFEITDDLPQYDLPRLIALRTHTKMPS